MQMNRVTYATQASSIEPEYFCSYEDNRNCLERSLQNAFAIWGFPEVARGLPRFIGRFIDGIIEGREHLLSDTVIAALQAVVHPTSVVILKQARTQPSELARRIIPPAQRGSDFPRGAPFASWLTTGTPTLTGGLSLDAAVLLLALCGVVIDTGRGHALDGDPTLFLVNDWWNNSHELPPLAAKLHARSLPSPAFRDYPNNWWHVGNGHIYLVAIDTNDAPWLLDAGLRQPVEVPRATVVEHLRQPHCFAYALAGAPTIPEWLRLVP